MVALCDGPERFDKVFSLFSWKRFSFFFNVFMIVCFSSSFVLSSFKFLFSLV